MVLTALYASLILLFKRIDVVAFCPSLKLHLPPSPHTLPDNQEDRLEGISYEELRRRPLAHHTRAPGPDGFYRLFRILGINFRDSQAYRVGKMGVASRHHGETTP